jgi:hypothetical protein
MTAVVMNVTREHVKQSEWQSVGFCNSMSTQSYIEPPLDLFAAAD